MAILMKKKEREAVKKVSVKSACSCYVTCSCGCEDPAAKTSLSGRVDAYDCASEYYKKFYKPTN